MLAAAAVTVVAGAALGGFGGKPAAAYVPVCGEGDLALEVVSELRGAAVSPNGNAEVLVHVRLATTGGMECVAAAIRLDYPGVPCAATSAANLRSGQSRSIGVLQRELASRRGSVRIPFGVARGKVLLCSGGGPVRVR